jgi:uncharacterized membrane protein YkoI
MTEMTRMQREHNMKRFTTRRLAIVAAVVVALAAIGGGAAIAAGGDDDATDTAISGTALAKASEAALAYTGEGHVTGTEVGDEQSYYEVEVTLDDGSQVDVQLDKAFNVVSSEGDGHDQAD